MEHLETCAQLEYEECSHPEGHKWSGWPGAVCRVCGAEDKNEVCLAIGCGCPCHVELWGEYERMCR